jgi:hypothetical protein
MLATPRDGELESRREEGRMRLSGTIPMIDVAAYAQWLVQ